MNTDALLERAPRPTSDYERLMDLFAELSSRTGNKLEVSLTLDESTFAALEADQRRPGKPRGEWVAVRDRVLVRFKRAPTVEAEQLAFIANGIVGPPDEELRAAIKAAVREVSDVDLAP